MKEKKEVEKVKGDATMLALIKSVQEDHKALAKNKHGLKKYEGQWVALLKGKIIAHGKDIKKVHSKAKIKNKTPVQVSLFNVPSKNEMMIF